MSNKIQRDLVLNTPKVLKQNQMENQRPESLGHSSDVVIALAASNPIAANASVNHKKLLFLIKMQKNNETPTLGKTLRNDGANHVTNSRVEAHTNAAVFS